MIRVCIIGLGYIGLPTAALLANRKFMVHGVDVKKEVTDIINQGNIHIVEPELDTYVRAAVQSGFLKASMEPAEADVFIIAVPTPFHEGYIPNIDFVMDATNAIAKYIRPGNIVILESTSPIGTTDKINTRLKEKGVDTSLIYLAHCPERVLPGHVMRELIENDRIVGGINEESTNAVVKFYRQFVTGNVIETDARTAEMCKLVENSYRDVNIAFANELSMICTKAGVDVYELIRLANHHPRVNILNPGVGVGGHCIAVDPWFIVADYPEESKLIKTGRLVNNHKTEWVIESIGEKVKSLKEQLQREPVIGCLGLAFKPDIDDLRESPALYVTTTLISKGLNVIAVEPNINTHPTLKITSLHEALEKADLFVFLVKHKVFRQISIPQEKAVLDYCGIFDTQN